MPETFFIGDTHFGHKNILVFDATRPYRPFSTIEEHDEALIANWNRVVGPTDHVWHLGDVAFGRRALALCGRLNGVKKLIMGNHDAYPSRLYLEYFSQIYGAFSMYGYLLTHVPVHPQQLERVGYGRGNIHGHLHSKRVLKYDFAVVQVEDGQMLTQKVVNIEKHPDPRYVCVSAEQINLTPIPLEEIERIQHAV